MMAHSAMQAAQMKAIAKIKRIGILGGSSDQATADYYRRLNRAANQRFGGWNTAELIITSMNFAFSAECVREGKWEAMGAYLADRAVALERGGAELFLCVSNTLHRVAETFTAAASIPFLHIVDPTARDIRGKGLRQVALLGTKPVMSTDYLKRRYRDLFDIDVIVPRDDEQDDVDRIIFDELCRGIFSAHSKAHYLELIDRLKARGVEGVILGCTEIPLLIGQGDRPAFPMFDTTALHVEAAMDMATARL
jgi:aspartate racemase